MCCDNKLACRFLCVEVEPNARRTQMCKQLGIQSCRAGVHLCCFAKCFTWPLLFELVNASNTFFLPFLSPSTILLQTREERWEYKRVVPERDLRSLLLLNKRVRWCCWTETNISDNFAWFSGCGRHCTCAMASWPRCYRAPQISSGYSGGGLL